MQWSYIFNSTGLYKYFSHSRPVEYYLTLDYSELFPRKTELEIFSTSLLQQILLVTFPVIRHDESSRRFS